eukprot:CAMPEP_0181261008 /NCGR_PEP_ID=MMETSP1097-20121128/1256_1 /TAXON_ID=35684 /ORGANISM="Pseudopedinella elastica, Strain CCMP716" /LENGTH=121 /DNA_ID=CAMNT_0023359577 /DNA_START=142 /DNA_END=503 /DNA_ORIENTATION=+
MAASLESRLDALEDAVHEKALMSAASDRAARRKIEGIFTRLSSTAGNGARLELPTPVFKRALQIYLNGVSASDLDALASRYSPGDEGPATTGSWNRSEPCEWPTSSIASLPAAAAAAAAAA